MFSVKNTNIRCCIILVVLLCIAPHFSFAQNAVIKDGQSQLIGLNTYFLEEKDKALSFDEVRNNPGFTLNNKKVLNLGLTNSSFWIKFTVVNESENNDFTLNIDQPNLNYVEMYAPDSNGNYHGQRVTGTNYNFFTRALVAPSFLFPLALPHNKAVTYYMKVSGNTPLVIPMFVGASESVVINQRTKNILFGIYAGIIICMLLYNMFLMFSIREDKSYIWYVLHTLFVGLTQASFFGYSFEFLWPDSPWLANESVFIFTCLVSVAGIIFMQIFLNAKETIPRLNKVFFIFFALYAIIAVLALTGNGVNAYKIMQPTQGMVALFILYISLKLVLDGYKQARFYLLSWFLLMIGIIIFALKDYNLVPYNNFTSTIMLSGSAAQVILLSFALADKINVFKREKEDSQVLALEAAQENARIIREQNLILETKVKERTMELTASNAELNKTLIDLKEAESQLVESEKMASLGQLTAGIAHEINNPINFVTSNVNPLRRDVEMLLDAVGTIENIGLSDESINNKKQQIEEYKEEIDFDYLKVEIAHLLKGISEGASRTAEIVKGLRIFSRLDEDDLKKADVNEGMDSTMVIVNNLLNGKIKVVKEYGNLPLIECYPGKLNQVYLNIISNAIHAIHKKYGEAGGGVLKISTSCNEKSVFVKIEDNGTGMDEATKKKIFEPFFTTKEVGEGTGLGMSIVYNTIKKHNGQIYVNSTPGVGTEFILDIPIIHEIL
ncbi:MAG: sensor histidine kinase [Bacteroidetes bacterium]|nr:sensor histidine kinase [Bacteroidota bacterium]